MRIYISGAMTGIKDLNFPEFFKAEEYLLNLGHEVVNPARLNGGVTDWVQCMRTDITALMACDALFCLKGWQNSKGANIEVRLAKDLGFRIVQQRHTFLGRVVTHMFLHKSKKAA